MAKRLLLSLTLLTTILTASAYDFMAEDGLCYNKNSDGSTVTVSGYTESLSEALIIPKSVTYNGITYSVTTIDFCAFSACSGLTSVTIPNSVTSIGDFAFSGCSGLTSITIPNSVTWIGLWAFENCTSLTSVNIGESVTSICRYAFEGCRGLTSVTWNAKNCNDFAEYEYFVPSSDAPFIDSQIKTFVFGDEVQKIPAYLLSGGCAGLTSVTIPNSVTSIGAGAFAGCTGLTSVHISDLASWCKIVFGDNPLGYAHNLYLNGEKISDLVIPNSVTSIGSRAFSGCSGLTSVTIPNSVTAIGYDAFYGCSGLTSVTIPNSVTEIGQSAFSGCSGLTSVTIPNSITTIGYDAFSGCTGLQNIYSNIEDPGGVSMRSGVFNHVPVQTCFLWVPANTVATYRSLSQWKDFTNIYAKLESISFDSPIYNVYIDGIEALSIQSFPIDAYIPNLSWSSSNTSIATVDQTGKVTAKKPGTAIITVAATDGSSVTATCQVTVKELPKITLNKSTAQIYAGGTVQLQATITPSDVIINTLTWSSSNTSVATVDQTGKVTAKKPGSATITVAATVGSGVTATCEVTVMGITKITLNKSSVQLCTGDIEQLDATFVPTDVIISALSWSSSNTYVATVDQTGKVTAKAPGTAIITVAATDGSGTKATCQVSVLGMSGISLNKTSTSLYVGDQERLQAAVITSDAASVTVTWSSSNTSVATVDQNGLVTARALGTAIITAKVTDTAGNSMRATCQVTVTGIEQITLNKTEANVYVGGTEQLRATITPSDVIVNTLTWSSNNTSAATVDQTGKVTAVAPGVAVITVAATDGSGVRATCHVTVGGITAIVLNKESATIYKGESETLKATIEPSDVIERDVTWSCNNPAIATVDQNGVVSGHATGTATVTVTANDGSGTQATCFITVAPAYALSSPDIDCVRGETVELPISFFNRKAISALEFMFKVPKIMTISTDSYGDYEVWLDDARRTRNHTVMLEPAGSSASHNYYKVVISSTTNNSLRGYEGVLLHVKLKPNECDTTGDFHIHYSDMTCAEPDETQHEDDNSSGLIHLSYLVGDANADVNVDVADYVFTANYILGRSNISYFYEDAANANYKDDIINVTDLVAIINYALELKDKEYRPSRLSSVEVAHDGVDYAMEAKVASATSKNAVVNLALDNDRPLAALQLDLELPSGVKLAAATATERAKGLDASVGTSPDGKARIILAGFGDGAIEAGFGDVLTLTLQGDIRTGDMMTVDDVTMAERDLTEHGIAAPLLIDISQTSGIDGASYDHVEIYVEHGSIVIESPIAGYAQLARLNGVTQTVEVMPGRNVYEVTTSIGDVIIASFNGVIKKFQF